MSNRKNSLDTSDWPSINALTAPLVRDLIADAKNLRIGVQRLENGCTIIDAGAKYLGGLEAGRRIAEICMGGLAHVSLQYTSYHNWSWQLNVYSNNPVLACLGSQYAGWNLKHGDYFSLGSGPGRALACVEELYSEIGYEDKCDCACLVLETHKAPPPEVVEKVARDTCVTPENLTFILTPTWSLAGSIQVVARVLEVALHKVHTLGFPLENIIDGAGAAPIAPPAKDSVTAMGRTNDAILFCGQVQLFVQASDDAAKDLAEKMPSSASRDYGKPFATIFKEVNYDFYKIDPMLFAPARVTVTTMDSGRSFSSGKPDENMLRMSFS